MGLDAAAWLGRTPRVRIELTRGTMVRRDGTGRWLIATPVPLPFHYGFVPGTIGGDGDPIDAIVLSGDLAVGDEVELPVRGVVCFLDDGAVDDKLVCGRQVGLRQRLLVRAFFALFVPAKRWLAWRRGAQGTTGVHRWVWQGARQQADEEPDRVR